MTYFSVYTRNNGKTNCFIAHGDTDYKGTFYKVGHKTLRDALKHIEDNETWANNINMDKVYPELRER